MRSKAYCLKNILDRYHNYGHTTSRKFSMRPRSSESPTFLRQKWVILPRNFWFKKVEKMDFGVKISTLKKIVKMHSKHVGLSEIMFSAFSSDFRQPNVFRMHFDNFCSKSKF